MFSRARTHQDVEAGGFEQGDLVGDGQRGEARKLLGKLHRLDDALGGQLAELVPEADVQRNPTLAAVALWGGGAASVGPSHRLGSARLGARRLPTVVYFPSWQSEGNVSWWARRTRSIICSVSADRT